MKFSLIVCTYMRPIALTELLDSVEQQTVYPDEIIIVDGSTNNETKQALENKDYPNLRYTQVNDEQRGLTKQRNIGIGLVSKDMEVVCFVDDDTILHKDYFKNCIEIFKNNSKITGVGGVAVNENKWEKNENGDNSQSYFYLDGYKVKLSSRFLLRKKLGLMSSQYSNTMPRFSHGNTQSFPLNAKMYEVDLLIGMSMAFRKVVVDNQKFSEYFEGYGLYEDADYSIRALKFGKNVISTNVQLEHHHHPSGRPNQFKYGKMMIRNGWYVWRLRWPHPGFKNVVTWYVINCLLAFIRLTNALNPKEFKKAGSEFIGRIVGMLSLAFNKPKIIRD